ncbi:hypothetical protein D6817_02955 [Candidatus Pacearchaeota archaeon]|nr:MAG: hypothetical protein D6817_02955 [Candidatus Pacearchaeota archaeon]
MKNKRAVRLGIGCEVILLPRFAARAWFARGVAFRWLERLIEMRASKSWRLKQTFCRARNRD